MGRRKKRISIILFLAPQNLALTPLIYQNSPQGWLITSLSKCNSSSQRHPFRLLRAMGSCSHPSVPKFPSCSFCGSEWASLPSCTFSGCPSSLALDVDGHCLCPSHLSGSLSLCLLFFRYKEMGPLDGEARESLLVHGWQPSPLLSPFPIGLQVVAICFPLSLSPLLFLPGSPLSGPPGDRMLYSHLLSPDVSEASGFSWGFPA